MLWPVTSVQCYTVHFIELLHSDYGTVVNVCAIGGDTIRQLQVQSGAHIELHRGAHPDPNEKLFNIRGSTFFFPYIGTLSWSLMTGIDLNVTSLFQGIHRKLHMLSNCLLRE